MRRQTLVLAAVLCTLCTIALAAEREAASTSPNWPYVWPKGTLDNLQSSSCTGDDCTHSSKGGNRPFFCSAFDCPPFKVLETSGSIQLRRYPAARWVATRIHQSTFYQGQLLGVKRLISYFAGANEYRVNLRPTVPLVTALFPASKGSRSVKGEYYLLAYIPEDRQDDPPRPTDSDVYILKLRAREFFVESFDGFADESTVIRKGWNLIDRLHEEHRRISSCVFGFAVYDPPTKLIFRHNEVWVPHRRRRHDSASDAPSTPTAGDDDDYDVDDGDWPEQGAYGEECSDPVDPDAVLPS